MKNLLSAKQLINIIESIPVGVVVADKNGNYIYVNKACEVLTGLNEIYLLGKNVNDIFSAGEISDPVTFKIVYTKREATAVQNYIKTGKRVLIKGSPIFDENAEVSMVVSILQDITEIVNIQEKLNEVIKENRLYKDEVLRLHRERYNENIIYVSKAMEDILILSKKVAEFESNVLILGESGVGKEKIARYIYTHSSRAERPCIIINCGAIPENLIESELFGYESGAFTGANKSGKLGLFEKASGGVVFLDEIGELPLSLQVKLLRVLQERKVMRVGSARQIDVDFRLIAATSKNLQEMVSEGSFRADLYYRINVIPIRIPPLRERKQDIPQLVYFFMNKFNEKYNLNRKMSSDVMNILMSYEWPGNVRQLENIIERLIVTSNGETVSTDLIPGEIHIAKNTHHPYSLKKEKEIAEKRALIETFKQCKTTREMASVLGVNQSTIVRKMKKYGIGQDD